MALLHKAFTRTSAGVGALLAFAVSLFFLLLILPLLLGAGVMAWLRIRVWRKRRAVVIDHVPRA